MTSVRFIVPTLKLRVELGIDKKGMSRYAEAEVQSQKPTATQIAYFIEMIRVGSGKSVSQASLKACFEKASRQPLDARSAGLGDESSPGVVCITGTSQKPLFKVAVFEGNPH